jgi:hypothetical protein
MAPLRHGLAEQKDRNLFPMLAYDPLRLEGVDMPSPVLVKSAEQPTGIGYRCFGTLLLLEIRLKSNHVFILALITLIYCHSWK